MDGCGTVGNYLLRACKGLGRLKRSSGGDTGVSLNDSNLILRKYQTALILKGWVTFGWFLIFIKIVENLLQCHGQQH